MQRSRNSFVSLHSHDGHNLDAFYCAVEKKEVGLIVIHEIFGLTSFVKEICEYWARKGYQTIAPALYDRYEKNVVIPYDDDGYIKALNYKQKVLNWDKQLLDIDAAKKYLLENGVKKIGIIGFSWGGTLGWLAACRLSGIDCVSSYYGTHIFQFKDEMPKCPVLLQFAERDELVPKEHVERIQRQHDSLIIHTYPAGHGFRCNRWRAYDANASAIADVRAETFFRQKLSCEKLS